MGKHDDSMFEIAEYLREEAREVGVVHPRRYEHWEITVRHSDGQWLMTAKWMLRRTPTTPAVDWIFELAKEVSKGEALRTESSGGIVRFSWKGKDDEREGASREGELSPCGAAGEEEDPRGLVGEVSQSDESDE